MSVKRKIKNAYFFAICASLLIAFLISIKHTEIKTEDGTLYDYRFVIQDCIIWFVILTIASILLVRQFYKMKEKRDTKQE